MAFTTLEERFNKKVNDLYAGANTKFDNGVPTTRANAEPFITRRPGSSQPGIKADNRSTPLSSTVQDVKRLTLFQTSGRGILFLLKQQLLQTGNTFQATRLLNPTFVIGNAVPFVHIKRAVDVPITARGIGRQLLGNSTLANKIFGSGAQRTDITSLRKIGQLQQETYDKAANKKDVIGSLWKRIPVIGKAISAVSAKRSVGDSDNMDTRYTYSRPEVGKSGNDYIILKRVQSYNSINLQNSTPTKTLQQQLGVTVSTNPIMDSSPTAKITNVFGMFDGVPKASKHMVTTNEPTNFIVKYGILGTRDDSYTTYLKFSDGQSKWTYQNKSTTDYNKYITNNYRTVLFSSRAPDAEYVPARTMQDVSSVVQDTSLETRYKPSLTQIEVNSAISDYITNTLNGQPAKPFIKYFSEGNVGLLAASLDQIYEGTNTNAREAAKNKRLSEGQSVKLSYIKDPLNEVAGPSIGVRSVYSNIPTVDTVKNNSSILSDVITVAFAIGKDQPIQFRAFITNLMETSTPTYNQYQYIGRIEKFISYTTVQRSINFKLGVIAYSKDEIKQVWKRINYLTGFAFPYGVNKGLFQPNIIRLTIGDVYIDQPGYIQSINTNFSGITETWDIDEENAGTKVPISATVEMQFTLIEKNGFRTATSPFYGITENMQEFKRPIPNNSSNTSAKEQPPIPAVVTPSEQTTPTEKTQPNAPTSQVLTVYRPQVPIRLEKLNFPKLRFPADNTRVTPRR